MKQAIAYLRVSGQAQVEGHGLQRQREAIEAYAKAHGMELVGTYADEGVSGTTDLDSRPGLGALMHRLESNGVRCVVVEGLDRLARDLMIQEIILGDMAQAGVELVSTKEGEDVGSPDPTRVLVRQVLGALAQYDKAMTVAKLRAARDAKRTATGKCEGPKHYGTVDKGERKAVQRIRELRRKQPGRARMGSVRIARIMQAEGHPTRHGGEWTAQTVKAILSGPVYEALGKRRKGKDASTKETNRT